MNEKEIKCILIDELLLKYPDAIIALEVPLLGGMRWVDLLLINNDELLAFEIKSELDSLKRLDGQISHYQDMCNRVYVILSEKFLKNTHISNLIPNTVGYGIITESNKKIIFKRQSKKKLRLPKENLAYFLWRKDLLKFGSSNDTTEALRKKFIKKSSYTTALRAAIQALSTRYKGKFDNFKKEKTKFTHIEDLEYFTMTYDDELLILNSDE